MAEQARDAMCVEELGVVADRGYYKGTEIVACETAGITTYVPKPLTSSGRKTGRFTKQDFVYEPEHDQYRCPAGEALTWRFVSVERGLKSRHVLDDGVSRVRDKGEVYDRARAPHQSLGA